MGDGGRGDCSRRLGLSPINIVYLVEVHVVDVLSAVVHAKGVAGEDGGSGVVVGEDSVWPVEVGRDNELEQMAAPQVHLQLE